MNTPEMVVIALLAIVAIASIAFWATRQWDRRRLRERFGPEYERTVESAENREAAEADLRARRERVDALEIRPLEPSARDRFVERWREVQAMFVDDPGNAVDQADTLIGEVMRVRGYPVGDFEQRAADVSVNHPQVVEHYRTAHATALKRRSGDDATEQLRQAFVHYRALFADLLETAEPAETDESGATAEARERAAVAAETDPQVPTDTEAHRSSAERTTAKDETPEPADTARRAR